jgi:hypothetical protein
MMIVIAALSVLLLSSPPQTQGRELAGTRFTSARAYFVGWNLLTRVPLGIDDVIRMKRVYFEINDPGLVANFVDWLRLSQMQKRESTQPADARLVIELTQENGDVTILYSDGPHVFSADSSRFREVDDAFRDRFDLARNGSG